MLGRAAVVVIVAVHLALCAAHASASCAAPGAGSPAVGAVVAGLAQHHDPTTGTFRLPHGSRLELSGGDAAEVGHVCVKTAVEPRDDAGGVPASAGPPVPPSCAPVAAAGCCCGPARVAAEASPARCLILRC
ncbi:hypothetical protein ACRYCC_10640 [Actinomadura scrupuli]|uniref:hypothetical protein n=1 Tax=Actinomadura scrupuli TaxID=559629 RepID=UPI003D95DA7E